MMAFNVNANSINVNALDSSDFELPDLGQNLNCVIVVVGCDGTGSVDSSGNTIIGSNNGNNNNTNPNQQPNPPTPIPTCEECYTSIFTADEIAAIEANFGTVQVNCADFESGVSISQGILINQLTIINISNEKALEFIECLKSIGVNIVP